MIETLGSGLIYRNPIPHVHSLHAYFPSVAVLSSGELVATIALGEAFEAANLHTHVCRSNDNGETWRCQGPLYEGTRDRLTSDVSRITAMPDGEIVAFTVRHDRSDHPDEGLTNPDNLGFVPTELLLFRSRDDGRTWTGPDTLTPPLAGPSFELCSPITPLSDGRWLLPTSTWQGWDGTCPNGIRTLALISRDRGRTWPEYRDIFVENSRRMYYWESKVVELPDKRLLAVAWAYDADAAHDEPNCYALSEDTGKSWSPAFSTGLLGQTLAPYALDDGRVLCIYRRTDTPGLWANVSRLDGSRWVNEFATPLWGDGARGLTANIANMSQNFASLKFGAPCTAKLSDGALFVAFWCYEDCVSVIRWFKLRVV